jgi:hypothetical protein
MEGWVPSFVSVWPAIITAHQTRAASRYDRVRRARVRVVGRIPDFSAAPSSPRHGSEIQGIEKRRGHWHDMAWMDGMGMMTRPSTAHHTPRWPSLGDGLETGLPDHRPPCGWSTVVFYS